MAFFTDVIIKTELIHEPDCCYQTETALNIAFGIDENFARPMGVAMTSVLMNNSEEQIVFHVFTDGIKPEDHKRLRELAQMFPVMIKLYYINPDVFRDLRSTLQWSIATYYRFIMGQVLHGQVDKILYLDADIICLGSLAELKQLDFGGKTVAAVNDLIDSYHFPIRMKKLGITSGKYFNAGMIYIDINRWHEKDISERSLAALAADPGKYDYLDQDILNVLLENDICYIDKKYNFVYNMEKSDWELPTDVILLHYATRQKPWHRWCIHPLAGLFHDVATKSPWKDVPLLAEPRNYKEMKMMAKAMGKEHQYWAMGYWYWRYMTGKLR